MAKIIKVFLILVLFYTVNYGDSIYTDGDDWAKIKDHADFALTGEFTLECWAILFSTDPPSASNLPNIFTKYNSGGGNRKFAIDYDARNRAVPSVRCVLGNATGGFAGTLSAVFAPIFGNWTHIAVVYKPGSQILYINNKSVDTAAIAGGTEDTPEDIFIGTLQDDTARSWDGYIDEIRIWNYARSVKQIESFWKKSIPGEMNGLILNLQFNEKIGNYKDYSGRGHHTYFNTGTVGRQCSVVIRGE